MGIDLVAPPGAPGAVCVDLASVVRVPIRRVAVRAMRVPDDVELYCVLKCVCVVCFQNYNFNLPRARLVISNEKRFPFLSDRILSRIAFAQ